MNVCWGKAPLLDVCDSGRMAIDDDPRVAVMRLVGSIGEDKPVSERAVKSFLSLNSYLGAERLHLVINSTGGDVAEAGRIYSILRSLPLPISAEVDTNCQSAAVTVLLAADYRSACADASIMIHRSRAPASALFGDEMLTAPQVLAQAKLLYRSDEREIELLALRTGYHRCWFEREQSTEKLMSHHDALRCGLLHAIQGKHDFSIATLSDLDRFEVGTGLPSEMLAMNYRQAARVAAMALR